MKKKEEIILSTLDLASKYGLKSLSMSQIAESVGIKKPSLYNHFESKETLIKEMYQYIREKSKENISNIEIKIDDKSAKEILNQFVFNYKKMTLNENLLKLYKTVYSERTINEEATKIILEETNKMINATIYIFNMLKNSNKLNIDNIEIAASSFALTIHSLIDYELDCIKLNEKYNENKINEYIDWFCNLYSKEK